MSKTETINDVQQDLLAQKRSFQQWLPIEDVDKGFIKVKNYARDEYYPVISIGDLNIDLLTDSELFLLARNIESAIAASNVNDFQFLLMPVPYDVETWLKHVDSRIVELEKQREAIDQKVADAQRNDDPNVDLATLNADRASVDFYIAHMRGQRAYVMGKLSDGSIVCKKAFMIPKFDNLTTLSEYQDATNTVVARFNSVIPGTTQLNSQAIRNLLFTILNPLHQRYVKVPSVQLPPVTRFGGK